MGPRVLIAQPLYSHVPPIAHASFSSFLCTSMGGAGLTLFQSVNMYIDQVRNDAVKLALGEHAQKIGPISHILYVDSDMVLPSDGLVKLLAHAKPIVSGLYFGKLPPFAPVAFNITPALSRINDYEEGKVMEVDGVGMGFCLVDIEVFKSMRHEYGDENWFRCGEGIGEDVWFFMRAKDMGIKCLLDTRVECGHVGELTVTSKTFKSIVGRASSEATFAAA